MDLALNFDQLTFLLKLLNPDADIRKIDPDCTINCEPPY